MKNVSIKKIILAIIALIIGLGFHMGSSKLLKLAGISFTSSILDSFINELLFAAVVVAIIFIIKKKSLLSFDRDCLVSGLKAGSPVIIYSIVLILFSLGELSKHTLVKGWEIVLFILFNLLIGIAEEGLFRGVVQELVLDAFATKTRKQLALGIFVSSALFGSAHFFNLFKGASPGAVLIQALTATAAGMLFGAICVRSGRNIWAGAIIHAIMDCGSFINSGMLWGQNAIEAVNGLSVGAFVSAAVDIILFIYLVRHLMRPETENVEKPETSGTCTKKSTKKVVIITIAAFSFILMMFLLVIPIIMTRF